jgi:hypothetical protein
MPPPCPSSSPPTRPLSTGWARASADRSPRRDHRRHRHLAPPHTVPAGCPAPPGAGSFWQPAVKPSLRGASWGGGCRPLAESRIETLGSAQAVIDTSSQATEFVDWYLRQGYAPGGSRRRGVTTDDSTVLVKQPASQSRPLTPSFVPCATARTVGPRDSSGPARLFRSSDTGSRRVVSSGPYSEDCFAGRVRSTIHIRFDRLGPPARNRLPHPAVGPVAVAGPRSRTALCPRHQPHPPRRDPQGMAAGRRSSLRPSPPSAGGRRRTAPP